MSQVLSEAVVSSSSSFSLFFFFFPHFLNPFPQFLSLPAPPLNCEQLLFKIKSTLTCAAPSWCLSFVLHMQLHWRSWHGGGQEWSNGVCGLPPAPRQIRWAWCQDTQGKWRLREVQLTRLQETMLIDHLPSSSLFPSSPPLSLRELCCMALRVQGRHCWPELLPQKPASLFSPLLAQILWRCLQVC